jgi:hypothetical protein
MLSAQLNRISKWRRYAVIWLAAFWTAGLLFGASAAEMSEHYIFSLMQRLFLEPLSIVGLLIQILFSLLLTISAVILIKPELFFIAAFTKAFFLAYFLKCMVLSSGSTVAFLYWLLSPAGALPAMSLLYFWTKHIYEFRESAVRDLVLCITMHAAAGFSVFICGR